MQITKHFGLGQHVAWQTCPLGQSELFRQSWLVQSVGTVQQKPPFGAPSVTFWLQKQPWLPQGTCPEQGSPGAWQGTPFAQGALP